MNAVGLWTINELAEWAADALAGGESARPKAGGSRRTAGSGVRRASPVSGRVRELPDPRTIRWYQTSGLVDRPLALRGRTALYGPRHLAQVVAIKRLQAEGHPLATIQARLAGASDDELVRLARLPRGIVRAATATNADPTGSGPTTSDPTKAAPVRARFWTAPPSPSQDPSQDPSRRQSRRTPDELAGVEPRTIRETPSPVDENPVVQGIRLAPGVLLVLDSAGSAMDDETVAAVRRAAQPVVKTLQNKGLLAPGRTRRSASNDLEEPA